MVLDKNKAEEDWIAEKVAERVRQRLAQQEKKEHKPRNKGRKRKEWMASIKVNTPNFKATKHSLEPSFAGGLGLNPKSPANTET